MSGGNTTITRVCRKVGCNNTTSIPNGYCEEHQDLFAEKQKQKVLLRSNGKKRADCYNHAWTKVRARKLRADPYCERCFGDNFNVAATIVHHTDENPTNNNIDNLISVCFKCHEFIHGRRKYGQNS